MSTTAAGTTAASTLNSSPTSSSFSTSTVTPEQMLFRRRTSSMGYKPMAVKGDRSGEEIRRDELLTTCEDNITSSSRMELNDEILDRVNVCYSRAQDVCVKVGSWKEFFFVVTDREVLIVSCWRWTTFFVWIKSVGRNILVMWKPPCEVNVKEIELQKRNVS